MLQESIRFPLEPRRAGLLPCGPVMFLFFGAAHCPQCFNLLDQLHDEISLSSHRCCCPTGPFATILFFLILYSFLVLVKFWCALLSQLLISFAIVKEMAKGTYCKRRCKNESLKQMVWPEDNVTVACNHCCELHIRSRKLQIRMTVLYALFLLLSVPSSLPPSIPTKVQPLKWHDFLWWK